MSLRGKRSEVEVQAQEALTWLRAHAKKKLRDEMGPRYGLPNERALGVAMADIKRLGKQLERNHALAAALWDTGVYEARLLCSFVDDPAQVSAAQMDRWCRDFDNWGVCDTLCFNLFDRTPHALGKVRQWARLRGEFQQRAAFALLACLALHRRDLETETFLACLPLIEKAADDERNFVKKAVSWALRAIALRDAELRSAALALAQHLAASTETTPRWIGKDVLRQIKAR